MYFSEIFEIFFAVFSTLPPFWEIIFISLLGPYFTGTTFPGAKIWTPLSRN